MSKVPHINIFIAYCHKDDTLRQTLRSHLAIFERSRKWKGNITIWDDGRIDAGTEWKKAINHALNVADIILLLISADFIASDYCMDTEMEKALQLHEDGKARVIPIILRECLWEDTDFGELQALPKDGKPITSKDWNNPDRPYTQVTNSIKNVIEEAWTNKETELAAEAAAEQRKADKAAFEKHSQAATAFFKDKKWSKAIEQYKAAQPLYQAGFEPTKEAISANIKHCNIEIGYAVALGLGKTDLEKGSFETAIQYFKKAIGLKHTPAVAAFLKEAEQADFKEKETTYRNGVVEAHHLFFKKEWTAAQAKYEAVLPHFKNGMTPPKTLIEAQINACKNAQAAASFFETGKAAYDQKDLKTALEKAEKAFQILHPHEWTWTLDSVQQVLQLPKPKIIVPEKPKTPEGMILVEGGSFMVGDEEWKSTKPVHKVTLDSFYIGKYAVTNEEYARFLNEYGSIKVKDGEYKGKLMIEEHEWGVVEQNGKWQAQKGYEKHPVIMVTWYGANTYAQFYDKRLPTEAEWEYAARGGIKSKGYKYAGDDDLEQVGWYRNNSGNKTHQVGKLKPNKLGIYDMSGNVWEWCSDWYDENYYNSSPSKNPKGATAASRRVLRGGSWNVITSLCRVSLRLRYYPTLRYISNGFRLAQNSLPFAL